MSLILSLLIFACTTPDLGPNWRVDEFLWKPVSENYDGLAVVTLPRGEATKVQVLNRNNLLIKNLKFRSVGSAGDAWADYNCNGACYRKNYGWVYVRVWYRNQECKKFKIRYPGQRSDQQ